MKAISDHDSPAITGSLDRDSTTPQSQATGTASSPSRTPAVLSELPTVRTKTLTAGDRPRPPLTSKGGVLHPNKFRQTVDGRYLNQPPFRAWQRSATSTSLKPTESRLDPRGFSDVPVPPAPAKYVVAEHRAEPAADEHTLPPRAVTVLSRMVGNLATAAARDGTLTLLSTYFREVVGHAAAKGLHDAPERVKIALSGVILGTTALLNALVFLEQRKSGRANGWTKSGQLGSIALISGAAAIAGHTGGLGDAAPLLVKATIYTMSRDILNLFVRLGDNRDPTKTAPNRNAVLMDSVIYGINQFVVNTLQGSGISKSGTSAAMASQSAIQAAPALLAFSAANAFGETMDAVCYPALTAFFDRFDIAPTWWSGVEDGMRAVRDLKLTARLYIPFVSDAFASRLGGGSIGSVSKEDFADKVTGAMLGRQSLFVALFALVDAISQVGPTAKLDPTNAARVSNVLAALAIGLMMPLFVGTVSASPRRRAGERDIELGEPDRQSIRQT